MPSIKTKVRIGAGVISAGALGGMGYGIHAYNSTIDTVKNYLINNGFDVFEEEGFWDKVLETYKLEKTTDTAIETETADGIRDWCRQNLKEKIRSASDSLFKKASKWCVNYETIEEVMVAEENPETLRTNYEHLEANVKRVVDEIAGISYGVVDGAKIKAWCDTNKKRRFSKDENEFFSSNLMEICTKSDRS